MSEIAKALDQSHQLAAVRRRGLPRLPTLLQLRKTSKRRPLVLLLTACACLAVAGSAWMNPTTPTRPQPASTPQQPDVQPDPRLAQALDKLIIKVLVSGPFPRVLTENGPCIVNQELLPGLYLSKIKGTTLIAVDGNGAVYHKKF